MKLVVLTLILLMAIGFFILGAILKEEKRGGYAMLSGFILLILGGLLVAGLGLEYQSGSLVVDSGASILITYEFTSVDAIERAVISSLLMLAGLWGSIVVALAMRDYSRNGGDSDE